MITKTYKKKIINNFLISKFNIKNIFKLPEIKKLKISAIHKNNKLFFFLVISVFLLIGNYPKKTITRKKQGANTSTNLQLDVSLTKKKDIYNTLTILIFLIYSEIPGFKGFTLKNLNGKIGSFDYNILPYFFELNKRVSRKELPLRNKTINLKVNIEFNQLDKKKNIFVLRALHFPINGI